MTLLSEANEYIKNNRVSKDELPVFHVTAPVGWMNDPNGFSVYKNRIHLFYQFHPYSSEWGPMHWGHYVSDDMVKWQEEAVALAPDESFDNKGCFSGTAIESGGKHILVYTGVYEVRQPDGKPETYQSQCLAHGDGHTYSKYSGNPVIDAKGLPKECSRVDFRDPKIFVGQDGKYKLIAGNKTIDGRPQLLLFESENLTSWDYAGIFASDTTGQFGHMWECPDYFKMDDTDVVIVSPLNMTSGGQFHNGNNVVGFIGKVIDDRFVMSSAQQIDYGFDFYAPQSLELPDGRRILIAWMQSWDMLKSIPEGNRWAGMMTLPREISVVDNTIIQNPIRELNNYRTNAENKAVTIEDGCSLSIAGGRVIDLTIDIASAGYEEIKILLASDETHNIEFSVCELLQEIICDRTMAGWTHDINCVRKIKTADIGVVKKLRFIMDRYSVELFVNGGVKTFTSTIYTPLNASGISIWCKKKAAVHIEKYDIQI